MTIVVTQRIGFVLYIPINIKSKNEIKTFFYETDGVLTKAQYFGHTHPSTAPNLSSV